MVFAYIDPGSGSMLIQVLIAGVLAVPFFFRNAIAGVLRRIRSHPPESTAEATDTHSNDG
ncbi:MAG: hypothetical protein M3295_09770 [Chloroflexota bacterium]|nr:hypothetical protein [Chloroflexota bacterium]